MTVIPMDELVEDYVRKGATGIAALAAKVAAVVAGPAYLSFDIDVLDPAFAPGTGTPEAGGLATREAQQILRALLDVAEQGALDVVAADLVEVAPPFDAADMTSLAAANLLHDVLAILATGVARRRRTS
jgi:guanidinopropionase